MEGMSASNICNGGGSNDNSGGTTNYIAHHDPFVYFNNIAGNSNRCINVVSTTNYETSCTTTQSNADSALLSDLNASNTPAFMWLTPNNYDNSHDCTLGQGANTFAQYIVPKILNSKTFLNDPTATLWITFDEPSTGTYGTTPVYMAVLGPGAKTAYTSGATLYTHRSLLHTFETNFSAGCIYPSHQDCAASTMFEFTKPDFYMNPGTWGCAMVTSCNLTITLLSINGFNGYVLLSLLYWPTYTYTPSNVTVSPGIHSTSALVISGTCSLARPSIKAVSSIGTSAYGPGGITCPISPK